MKRLIEISFLFLLVISTRVTADNNAVSQGEVWLEKFLGQTDTLQAEFNQVLRTHDGEVLQESAGMFYLHRPGRFRWNYRAPYEQIIVSDGQRIWMYDVELKQVTVQKQSATLSQTPMALLEKDFSLRENYEVSQLDERDGIYRLKLVNRERNSDFGEVVIGVSEQGLQFMQLHDQFDQVTDIVFSGMVTNTELDDDIFRFIPPEGADVFGG